MWLRRLRRAMPSVAAATAAVTAVAALTALTALAPPVTAADAVPARAGGASDPVGGACAAGELCLWEQPDFTRARRTYELSQAGTDACVALPAGRSAQALANRTGRPVTLYQSAECAEVGEFETYPGGGGGTWAPQTPYLVRAFKIWER